jgi:hypothetical protein
MNAIYWTIWVLDFLLLGMAIAGKNFRSGYGAGVDFNTLFILLLMVAMAGSLVIRFGMKQKGFSLVLVSLPLLAMILLYLYEKATGRTN